VPSAVKDWNSIHLIDNIVHGWLVQYKGRLVLSKVKPFYSLQVENTLLI
jgi:hypothetical protein